MKIEYDREANALYITLREAEVADTREVTEDLIVDFDANMHPVGIELLHVSVNLSPGDLTRVTVENLLSEADPPLVG